MLAAEVPARIAARILVPTVTATAASIRSAEAGIVPVHIARADGSSRHEVDQRLLARRNQVLVPRTAARSSAATPALDEIKDGPLMASGPSNGTTPSPWSPSRPPSGLVDFADDRAGDLSKASPHASGSRSSC
jgi:hypothetical protein